MQASAFDLTGKSVVVTGAARGLGAAIARTCIDNGATVVLTDVLADELEATVAELGPNATGRVLDVTDADGWEALAAELRAGGSGLDGLVNNAGIVALAPIEQTTVAAMQRALDVNVMGTFLGIQMFARLHTELGSPRPGSIVNIASVRGMIGSNNGITYCASKFGVRGLTKAAAVELGHRGIRVNTICPGPIESDMSINNPAFAHMDWDTYAGRLPLGRMGQPADIGAAAAWLVSDASGFVTGVDLPVDGGLTATSHTIEPRETTRNQEH
ncbi:MAG TPA: SDR family NAD(P)-dependent oxidoreductase [Ilumatobacter sp.]|nr:SDR family NAD(P)-dependent oxidoreductase [Ilumatobacter sp.]